MFSELPDEVIDGVVACLNIDDQARLACVSRALRAAISRSADMEDVKCRARSIARAMDCAVRRDDLTDEWTVAKNPVLRLGDGSYEKMNDFWRCTTTFPQTGRLPETHVFIDIECGQNTEYGRSVRAALGIDNDYRMGLVYSVVDEIGFQSVQDPSPWSRTSPPHIEALTFHLMHAFSASDTRVAGCMAYWCRSMLRNSEDIPLPGEND